VLRPTTGDLLRAVHLGLAEHVLPALPPGVAHRQLKAALHILRRLERSWDRFPAYLETENADISETLAELLTSVQAGHSGRYADLTRRLAATREPARRSSGISDERLAHLMAVNFALQEILADFDRTVRADREIGTEVRQTAMIRLFELYRRMLDRAGVAAGTNDDH